MARGRAKLTEKQERILVQCQLMGLTPRDMVQISNRLVALEKEREFLTDVEKTMEGLTYNFDKSSNVYEIVDDRGNIYRCKKSPKESWHSDLFDIKVLRKDGTVKALKHQTIYASSSGEVAKYCPENSKRLFRLCKAVKEKRWI